MSDCSTAAMLPKEQPKKCGTCYWMMTQPGHGECGACGNPEFGIEKWPEAYSNGYYLYTTVDGDCEGEFWTPRTETPEQRICHRTCEKCAVPDLTAALQDVVQIEQRYQQLEEVAREMLGCVFGHRYWQLRQKLESLGVSVDD